MTPNANFDLETICSQAHESWLSAHTTEGNVPEQLRVPYNELPTWAQNLYRASCSAAINEFEKAAPKTKAAGQ